MKALTNSFNIKLSSIALLTSLIVITIPNQSFCDAGNEGGHGGNVIQSTKADLQDVVQEISSYVDEVSDHFLFSDVSPDITSKPLPIRLAKITQTIFGQPRFAMPFNFTFFLSEYSHLVKIVDGPCYEAGIEKDASTEFRKSAPICLSASRLARFPKAALKSAVLPLLFHEAAHQYGFGEADANAFQALAEIHLKFRMIYSASQSTLSICAHPAQFDLSNMPTTDMKTLALDIVNCTQQAGYTANLLAENAPFEGVWARTTTINARLTPDEESALIGPKNSDHKVDYSTMIKSLAMAGRYMHGTCYVCGPPKENPAYIMMVGAKVALSYVDQEVGRLQDQIKLTEP